MKKEFAIFTVLLSAPAAAQETAEVTMVKQMFNELQLQSIAENVEFCGYVGFDANGALMATSPTRGEEGSCLAAEPVELEIITASYHTHGAHSPDYFNEVPSGDDMEGDADEGIDGYIATPAGRLWYVDSVDMVASQLCGAGCLTADPAYDPADDPDIAESYSYDDLIVKLSE
jgi:hypothetical protein